MIEQINDYLLFTACLFLLFIGAVIFLEEYSKPIHRFFTKKIPLLMDLRRDTVIKGLAITGAILFTRKLVFYLPYTGIIQTKFSIWWMDRGTLIFLHIIFVLYMAWIAAMVGLTAIVRRKLKFKIVIDPNFPALVQVLFFWGLFGILLLISKTSFSIPWAKVLILIVYAPLILFKMLCSGKYLGILTGFLLGYFIVSRYKKLSPLYRNFHFAAGRHTRHHPETNENLYKRFAQHRGSPRRGVSSNFLFSDGLL